MEFKESKLTSFELKRSKATKLVSFDSNTSFELKRNKATKLVSFDSDTKGKQGIYWERQASVWHWFRQAEAQRFSLRLWFRNY
ncbi:MAG: hypothetical protein D0531_02255 [Methylococcales bacterium]|nr:MAG: hypothetical protein D0531_02255 [Methylococcales bacterium]